MSDCAASLTYENAAIPGPWSGSTSPVTRYPSDPPNSLPRPSDAALAGRHGRVCRPLFHTPGHSGTFADPLRGRPIPSTAAACASPHLPRRSPLSPTGWPRPPCGWLLAATAEEHAAGSSSKKAASARGGPPAADSSRRRPTATPPAAPPAERQQGWGRGRSLPCLFLLPRSSQGTPKEHRRKLFAGSLVPNHRKIVQVICFPLCRLAVRDHCGCPPLSLICIN